MFLGEHFANYTKSYKFFITFKKGLIISWPNRFIVMVRMGKNYKVLNNGK